MEGVDTNPILTWMLASMGDTLPKHLIHPCPYFGPQKASNVTISSEGFTAQFFRGRYKTIFRWFDDIDDNIITFNLGAEFFPTRLK